MRKSLRSTDADTTIIENNALYEIYNNFESISDETVQKGKPYTFQQENLIENFIEENHYISIFPLLQAFNSINSYPNKEIIELLLNTCLNDSEDEVVNEACNIIQHISSIPNIFNYKKLKDNSKKQDIDRELPFEFLADEDESLYFDNIIYIMKNSLGNIEGYEKLNKDNEPNEVMEEINRVFFNIIRYKETRKIEKIENITIFFHTIVMILKNDILQNQNLMKKTMLYRIIKKITLSKLIINTCELFDYTIYYKNEQITFIQSDIQLFIYLISLYCYTKPKSSKDEKNYLINKEELINILYSNITERMLLPFIETITDIKIKQGVIERILQNKCNYEGRRGVPLHFKLDENKILGYCLNFIPRDTSCKGYLTIIHILFLLIQSFLINNNLTQTHKSEWLDVLQDIEDIVNGFSKRKGVDSKEIQYEEELFNYYNLFKIIILNYY
ncbi:hypothetical protein BCR32DRAFT_290135 [Anaeromyces robustus]|uniref:Uncharacterized protein n=1 Tax=Anaeromyces robustus TaxID=1754192 RepID=A0A1Y1XLD5_9FUNG|nr:hypothetical protein BCR32DRAFT_290135 [Anaeromyces robustus]|eukprot:ORX86286.1 hypothetical protein BCR32DRAFT_290135 [Anaeromyces robustus]